MRATGWQPQLLRPHGALRTRRALVRLVYSALVGVLGVAVVATLLAIGHRWHVRISLPGGGTAPYRPPLLPPAPPTWPPLPAQPPPPSPASPWWSVQAPPPSDQGLRRLDQFRPMSSIMRALGCQVRPSPAPASIDPCQSCANPSEAKCV
jgi:hypothetical protein